MTNTEQYDLLLKGGNVIDPANGIDEQRDVAIKDRKIAEVAAGLDESLASRTVDASGLHITPGLIDLHTHQFGEQAHIHPDVYAIPAVGFDHRVDHIDALGGGVEHLRRTHRAGEAHAVVVDVGGED